MAELCRGFRRKSAKFYAYEKVPFSEEEPSRVFGENAPLICDLKVLCGGGFFSIFSPRPSAGPLKATPNLIPPARGGSVDS